MLCLRTACRSSLAHGGSLTQRGRDGGLSRGCTAQLVFVPFLMGISEVGTTPRRPSSSSTAAVADVVPQNGLSLVAGSWRQFDTARARWRPEPRLHGSASVCTVPDGHFGGCVRAAGPQQQRYRRSGSQRTQIRLESALCGEVRQFWRVLVETAPSEPFHWLRLGAKPRFDP